MKKTITILTFLFAATSAFAGGALEQVDITGNLATPIPGHIEARLVGIKWDTRTLPVRYSMNTTLDPIPNPLGPAFLTVAAAKAVVQDSLNSWNNIPTSFIDMHATGAPTNNPGLRGFDMINEVTFRTANNFTAIASSPSTSLIADVTLVHGDQIDNDADADVSGAITVAQDVDGDGDIEFPAGFYKAGTILDNDVQYNTKATGLRFTADPAAIDAVTNSVDLKTVSVHEFGHSFGLSHSMINQTDAADGDGATMFPFIDTGDPAAELAQGAISLDDIAFASLYYPEGSASSGPAALQAGDVAFDKVFARVTGEIRHGVFNEPISGAAVFAVDRATGKTLVSAFSGTSRLSRAPNGALNLISPAYNILNGNYVLPVPKGNYSVGVEPVDGNPAAAGSISLTAQIGAIFGQMNFNEEYYNGDGEDVLELRPDQAKNVNVPQPGRVYGGINITTGRTININNFGSANSFGFTLAPSGRIYAVRIPHSQVTSVRPGLPILAHGIAFETSVVDSSVSPFFAEALLAPGRLLDATTGAISVDLANPLERQEGFLAQETDFSTFHFKNPQVSGEKLRLATDSGAVEDLFLVLRVPAAPFPGISGRAPLIGLDGPVASAPVNDVPIFGLSYQSDDGGVTWTRVTTFNFRFSLVLAEPN